MTKKSKSLLFKIIFALAGVLLLAYLLKSIGLSNLVAQFRSIGWRIFYIVGLHLLGNFAFTYAWRLFIDMPVSFRQYLKMYLARIGGDAGSSINAVGAIAGEPLKAMYIKDFVPMDTGMVSVILDRLTHNFSNMIIILTGIFISFFILKLPLYFILACFAVIIASLGVIIYFFIKYKNGFLQFFLSKLPKKLVMRFFTYEKYKKLRELDKKISILCTEKRKRLYLSLAIHYFTTLIVASLEIYLISIFIKVSPDFKIIHAVFIYIFNFILSTAMFFIPANIGVSEGSCAYALRLLGYDATFGVAIGLLKRVVSFIRAGIGVLILMQAGLLKKKGKSE